MKTLPRDPDRSNSATIYSARPYPTPRGSTMARPKTPYLSEMALAKKCKRARMTRRDYQEKPERCVP
jgi:hypothetical protein